jgi:tetratricopeptide (TPR) repeat protein
LSSVLQPALLVVRQGATEQRTAAQAAPTVQENELTAQQWFERGFAAVDNDEKLRLYSGAIHLQPDYAAAFNNRGIARQVKGDIEGALRDYNEAIRVKRDYAAAFNNRGLAWRAKGDIKGALRDYSAAIRLKPDDADAFNNRGNARGDKGDILGAI